MTSTRDRNTAIKQALRKQHPRTKFYVRQTGFGTEIAWEDGPAWDTVKAVAETHGALAAYTQRTLSETTRSKAEKLWDEHGQEHREFTLAGVRIMSGDKAHQVWQIGMHVVLTGRKHRRPRQVRTDRVLRYSPNSELISTTAEGILTWAADHITRVGLATVPDRLYQGPGTTIRFMRCSVGGAIEVAAGDGRLSSSRTYDYEAIKAAKEDAYRVLAAHLAAYGTGYNWRVMVRVVRDEDTPADHRRSVIHAWSTGPDRTKEQAAAVLREAAAIARENTPA